MKVPAITTFRGRLALRWTVAVGTLLALAHLAVYLGVRAYVERWLDHNVRTLAATEAASSTDGLGDVHLHEGPFTQLDGGGFTEKVVQIFDRTGRLVLQSTTLAGHPPVVNREQLEQAFAGQAPLVSAVVDGRTVRVAVLTAEREGRPYAVAVGLFSDEVDRGLTSLAWWLVAIWLTSLVISAAIAYGLASRALEPVARIAEKAAWIAQGRYDTRLDRPIVDDEVGRMTILLNSMLDRLQGALDANRRFAADASHELRGPLTAMAGEIDVALRHPRSAERYAETLRHVRGQLSALTRLAEDLIVLVRAQEGSRDILRREVALRPLVEDAFARIAAVAASRGITLTHADLDDLFLYADAMLVGRVFDNVIANAVLYNRDGGSVHVAAAVDHPDEGAWAAPIVRILVRDTGSGIPCDSQERIFERFYRLDQSRTRHTGGSGLGLAICREVVSLHGGTIQVTQSSAAGTEIEIRLPGGPHLAAPDRTRPHPSAPVQSVV
jgi:signal transduction histidine kinase